MSTVDQLITFIVAGFQEHPAVESIALGGSRATGSNDTDSDIDLYVFTNGNVPLAFREELVRRRGATRADIGLEFWDSGDEWLDRETATEVDVIFWHTEWIERQLQATVDECRASVGYSTCHWHTIKNLRIDFDRNGWLTELKRTYNRHYPERLKAAIIDKNYPLIRDVIPSFLGQIEKALRREDPVSINHRVAALLASYFDIVFAWNETPHPGEKRQLEFAVRNCRLLPDRMTETVTKIISSSGSHPRQLPEAINQLADNLDRMLKR